MSSTQPPHEGPAPDSPSDVRVLPARPNLEFERKQAKKLLAQVRRGNPEAIAWVYATLKGSRDPKPDEFKLADAQFTIARGYGFTSWPRLVEYFETLARHEVSGGHDRHHPKSHHEAWARSIVVEHRDRRAWTVQMLMAYVPRFYGRSVEQVLGSEITLDDARLASARMNRYPSWEAMMSDIVEHDAWQAHDTPLSRAMTLVRGGDLDGLKQLVEGHPELLSSAEQGHPRSDTLARNVVLYDMKTATPESRRVYEWLRDRVDLAGTLNGILLGYMRMTTGEMQRLLDRGADPAWTPPNGYSVLEHVIWRCWSAEIVDMIAARVKPREGFWIAAGLGDADAVKRYFDVHGKLTDAARKNRPDFNALGPLPMASNPAPDDEEIIWEAFMVAGLNQRFAVLDVLLDHGFPIDYIGWGQTLLHLAVGNAWVPLVEYLVKRGANLDLKGWRPFMTARETAEQAALNPYGAPQRLRILEICGGRDIETLRRERDARRAQRIMPTSARVEDAFNFAKHDAVTRDRKEVDSESLFIGLLHEAGLAVAMLGHAGVDLKKLRGPIRDRVDSIMVDAPAEMTANPEVKSILMDARTLAEERKEEHLTPLHVFYALLKRPSPAVLTLIESAGGTREGVLASIESVLPPVERPGA